MELMTEKLVFQEALTTFYALIGADLMNLGAIRGLGTPVASIGGAGTFDGIFVTGIGAVLLASLIGALSHSPAAPDTA